MKHFPITTHSNRGFLALLLIIFNTLATFAQNNPSPIVRDTVDKQIIINIDQLPKQPNTDTGYINYLKELNQSTIQNSENQLDTFSLITAILFGLVSIITIFLVIVGFLGVKEWNNIKKVKSDAQAKLAEIQNEEARIVVKVHGFELAIQKFNEDSDNMQKGFTKEIETKLSELNEKEASIESKVRELANNLEIISQESEKVRTQFLASTQEKEKEISEVIEKIVSDNTNAFKKEVRDKVKNQILQAYVDLLYRLGENKIAIESLNEIDLSSEDQEFIIGISELEGRILFQLRAFDESFEIFTRLEYLDDYYVYDMIGANGLALFRRDKENNGALLDQAIICFNKCLNKEVSTFEKQRTITNLQASYIHKEDYKKIISLFEEFQKIGIDNTYLAKSSYYGEIIKASFVLTIASYWEIEEKEMCFSRLDEMLVLLNLGTVREKLATNIVSDHEFNVLKEYIISDMRITWDDSKLQSFIEAYHRYNKSKEN